MAPTVAATATSGSGVTEYVEIIQSALYAARFEIVFLTCAILLFGLGSLSGRIGGKKQLPRSGRAGDRGERSGDKDRREHRSAQSRERGGAGAGALRQRPGAGAQRDDSDTRGALELQAAVDGVGNKSNLGNAAWVMTRLAKTTEASQACAAFLAALGAGMDPKEASAELLEETTTSICLALVRSTQSDDALQLLTKLQAKGVPLSSGLCSSLVRLCTSKQYFREAVAFADVYLKDTPTYPPQNKSVWSCLLFCAVELRLFGRCPHLIEQLKACGTPGVKDYWNMIRYHSANRECDEMFKILDEMKENNMEADSVIYNTVLASCVSCNRIVQARSLLDRMSEIGGVADVITYNTLMKGYAKAGSLDECFRLFGLMKERDLTPSQVTYGILLDGCINGCQVDKASDVFDIMLKNECPMNTVLYTTLIKGFAREGKVDEAMRVYGQMQKDSTVQPDLITFSVLMKANCDANRLDEAFGLLDAMLRLGLHPDEVIFNNLLSGCAKAANGELANRIYSDMIASGIKPSNATFSTLVRIYSQCKLLDMAVDMVKNEPKKYQVELESRVFSQLIQACIRARQGRRAVEVYEFALETQTPPPALHSAVLSVCTKLNMYDTAADLLAVAAAKGARIDARDASEVLQNARRKQKSALVARIETSLQELGIPLA
eukprot:TRINITY_DN27036_c0_g2_i1.p1 TRINITY_DN27036_c0_g2~~TRINITY_DN27036_c0_g2_i1.p1  ORF type:complete len:739 (+),score=198.35 TRINITY_DN27036_c0_g2_i1:226-2217(+)